MSDLNANWARFFSQFEMKVVAATSPWSNYIVYQRLGYARKVFMKAQKWTFAFLLSEQQKSRLNVFVKCTFLLFNLVKSWSSFVLFGTDEHVDERVNKKINKQKQELNCKTICI